MVADPRCWEYNLQVVHLEVVSGSNVDGRDCASSDYLWWSRYLNIGAGEMKGCGLLTTTSTTWTPALGDAIAAIASHIRGSHPKVRLMRYSQDTVRYTLTVRELVDLGREYILDGVPACARARARTSGCSSAQLGDGLMYPVERTKTCRES